jgi:transposase InsO family protein
VDRVQRRFYAEAPDRLWVADMTYVPTWSGFLYLAMVLDVYSRRVVGCAMDTSMKTELILSALNAAIMQRRPEAVIHHSDRGCQYTSYAFGKRCQEAGIMPSMGSVGDAYDNAMVESFFAPLERELLNRRNFRTQAEAKMAMRCSSIHSRPTASKVFVLAAFSARRLADGSTPAATSLRAASRFSRASLSPTSGTLVDRGRCSQLSP